MCFSTILSYLEESQSKRYIAKSGIASFSETCLMELEDELGERLHYVPISRQGVSINVSIWKAEFVALIDHLEY
jgi:hypothetical protein